jgi:uncharacterized protein (DUF1501 family)
MTSRRFFLRSSALAAVSFGAMPRLLVRAALAAGRPRGKTLVVVFQRGACDGLNTVVPYGESAYRAQRPTIGLPAPNGGRDAVLDLDGFFGLHPALEPLLPAWREGSLCAVHAVGSPDSTRSHFDAQDFMESGTPGVKSTEDGWMNRSLWARPRPEATPLRAVSATPVLPRILSGRAPAIALHRLDDFRVRPAAGAAVARGFEDMYDGAVESALRGAGQEAFEAIDFLRKSDPGRQRPSGGARYPRGPLGESLQQVAHLIKSDVGLELAFAEVGGWDHHAAQGALAGPLAARLRDLGGTLAAFHRDLGERLQDVVLVTLTEFGRTVRENGNRGTDHGHGSVALVLGGAVRGGRVLGRWPGLRSPDLFEGRDLAVTTDFRAVLGELLARHLGVEELASVFPGFASSGAFPGVMR